MRILAPRIILLTISLALSACAGGNIETEWSCPADQPVGCYTVSDADKISLKIIEPAPVSIAPASIANTAGIADTANPIRSQRVEEELTAVWIGAFVDEDDNYHPASEIFIVVRPPKWKLQ